jgi:hypothetical protein
MKKFLIPGMLAVFVLFLPARSRAAGAYGVQPAFTYQAAVSSITTTIITVSTSSISGATQMDNPQMASRVAIEIQNIDTAANLWCLPVSTTPTANAARKIAAGSSWSVSSMDNYYTTTYSSTTGSSPVTTNIKFWCLSDGAAATKAAVTQAY